ncbi:putative transposase [Stanieria sp. NIES-3757]|nr:putative transposase [Stanieria sp. NIES-3757]
MPYRTHLVSFLLKIDYSESANIKQLNFKIGVSEILIDIMAIPRKIKACGYSQISQMSSIETVNDQLKNISQIEHSRHRSPVNFCVNVLCELIAY